MKRKISIIGAKNQAQSILEDKNLMELPIDIDALAEKSEIEIEEMPVELAKNSIYGAILAQNDIVKIFYSTAINNIGFQRFTLAHELGHYFLDWHLPEIQSSGGFHISESDFGSKSMIEHEADHFASGLLMPEKLCKKLVAQFDDGLSGIRALADEAWASLTAAAIRYIDLTSAQSAVIISTNCITDYSICTKEISKQGMLPLKGTPIPSASLTAEVGKAGYCRFDDRELETDLSLWVGGTRSIDCKEECVKLGRTGKVLTVLTCPQLDEEEDEDMSDEDFDKRWGFTFR